MKKLLMVLVSSISVLCLGCATWTGGRGPASDTSSQAKISDSAPASLRPPDFSADSKNPLMSKTYASAQADYHFTMGETLSLEGQTARAIEEFKTTLVYDPGSATVHRRLASEYLRMDMTTEGLEQAEAAVKAEPTRAEFHLFLGTLYANLKMFEPARAQFKEAEKLDPKDPRTPLYLGSVLLDENRLEEALALFRSLTERKDFAMPEQAHYYVGRTLHMLGPKNQAEVEKAFHRALQIQPDFPDAALALTALYYYQDRYKKGIELLTSYQEKFGPNKDMSKVLAQYFLNNQEYDRALQQLENLEGFERDNLNVKIQIALLLIEKKSYQEAAVRLEDILRQAPESDKVRYYLGAVYEELERPDLARLHYLEVPAGSSYYPDAVIHTAHLFKKENKLVPAIEVVEKAIAKQDDLPQLYGYYATLLDEAKKYKEAIAMLSQVVDRFPTQTQLRFFLGTMHDRMGQTDHTISQMKKVIEQDSEHVQALNYLAYTYAETGRDLDEAHELAQRAFALQPNDGYIMDTLGWIHFKKGETETAIRYLEAAYKLKNDEAIIAEHLGDAYVRFQMWGKAKAMYQKAVAMEVDINRNGKIQDKLSNLSQQVEKTTRMPASVTPKK